MLRDEDHSKNDLTEKDKANSDDKSNKRETKHDKKKKKRINQVNFEQEDDKLNNSNAMNIVFNEDQDQVVMEVEGNMSDISSKEDTDQSDDGSSGEDSDCENDEELLEQFDYEDESEGERGSNNNVSMIEYETVMEVPTKFRLETDSKKRIDSDEKEKDELREIKAMLSRFEDMLTNNILIRNPEYNMMKPKQSKGMPSKSQGSKGGKSELSKKNKTTKKGIPESGLNKGNSPCESVETNVTIYPRTIPLIDHREMDVDSEIQFNFRNSNKTQKGLISSDEILTSSGEEHQVAAKVDNEDFINFADRFYDRIQQPGTSRNGDQMQQAVHYDRNCVHEVQ